LSEGVTHKGTTRVFALFSASDALGKGENGLMATFTATDLLFLGALALTIL
jgi:hypothetical protein